MDDGVSALLPSGLSGDAPADQIPKCAPKQADFGGKMGAKRGQLQIINLNQILTVKKWDAVFEDGDLYKSGLLGQGLYVSPETDTVVVCFSTTWQNIHPMTAYPRAIVQQIFRE